MTNPRQSQPTRGPSGECHLHLLFKIFLMVECHKTIQMAYQHVTRILCHHTRDFELTTQLYLITNNNEIMVHKCFLINPVWFISILISLEVIIRVNIQLILESPIPRSTNHWRSELGSGQPNRIYQQNNLTAAP